MKLDNRGFAISTFMYMLLILAMILILATLAIFSSRKMILDKQKNIAMENSLATSKKICKAVSGVKSLELGTEYECKVNNTDTFTFYVLSLDGTKVNLIMDRNICEDGTDNYSNDPNSNYCRYAWHSGEDDSNYGPDTAMTYLYNATKNWSNVPKILLRYSNVNNNSYKKIVASTKNITITKNDNNQTQIELDKEKPLRTRLAKHAEVLNTGCLGNYGTCPAWMVDNLQYYDTTANLGIDKYSNNNNATASQNMYGYWTLDSFATNVAKAEHVTSNGYLGAKETSESARYGIRPVITVSKTNLYS